MKKTFIALIISFLMIVLTNVKAQDSVTFKGSILFIPANSFVYFGSQVTSFGSNSKINFNSASAKIILNSHLMVHSGIFINQNIGFIEFKNKNIDQKIKISSIGHGLPNLLLNNTNKSLILQTNINLKNQLFFNSGNVNLNGKNINILNDQQDSGRFVNENNNSRILSGPGFVIFNSNISAEDSTDNLFGTGISLGPGAASWFYFRRGHTSINSIADSSIRKYFDIQQKITSGSGSNKEIKNYQHPINIKYFDADFSGLPGVQENKFKMWQGTEVNGYNDFSKINESSVEVNNNICNSVVSVHFDSLFYKRITVADEDCNVKPAIPLPDSAELCQGDSISYQFKNYSLNPYNYSFQWFDDNMNCVSTTYRITIKTPGKYKVLLTNPNGCFNWDSIRVKQNPLPNPIFTINNSQNSVFLCPYEPANFLVNNNGMSLNTQLRYGDGDSTNLLNSFHSYNTHGTYNVQLLATSLKGCKKIINRTVNVFQPPDISLTTNNTCLRSSAQFSVTNVSTLPLNKIYWSFGDTTGIDSCSYSICYQKSHKYKYPGTYNVRVIVTEPNKNCADTAVGSVQIYPHPKVNFNSPPTACATTPVAFNNTTVPASGTTMIGYLWNFGDGNTSISVNPNNAFGNPNIYNVILQGTDSRGCKDTAQKQINILPIANINVNVYDTCLNKPTRIVNKTIIPNGFTATHLWNFGDGFTSNEMNPTHLYKNAGSYTITYNCKLNNGCEQLKQFTVRVYENPVAGINLKTDTFCVGETVQFSTESQGKKYKWFFGDGQTSNLKEPTNIYYNAGSFLVTLIVYNNVGCTDTASQWVYVNPSPQSEFSIFADKKCVDNSIIFVSNDSINEHLWSFGDKEQSNLKNVVTHKYKEYGTYTVSLTITNGYGCSKQSFQNIRIGSKPNAKFSPSQPIVCEGIPATFINQSNIAYGDTIKMYKWYYGNGNGQQTNKPINVSHLYTDTGNYNVELITISTLGCSDTAQNKVFIAPVPEAYFTYYADTFCVNLPVRFKNYYGKDTNYRYEWEFSDHTVSYEAEPLKLFNRGQQYAILTTTNRYGCSNTYADYEIAVFDSPTAGFFIDGLQCTGNILDFINKSEFGGSRIVSVWDFGDMQTSNEFDTQHSYDSAGNYNVTLTTYAENACRDVAMKNIQIYQTPNADFEIIAADNKFCSNVPIIFSNSNSNDSTLSHFWEFSNGLTSKDINPVLTFGVGNYTVKLTTEGITGCSDEIVKYFTIGETPVVNFSVSPTICSNQYVSITNTTVYSGDSVLYIWDFGDSSYLVTSEKNTIQHQYLKAGTYPITLKAKTNYGCEDIKTINITVFPTPIPNYSIAAPYHKLCSNIPITFINANTDTTMQHLWSFNNGFSSNDISPVINFAPGLYHLNYVVTNKFGCSSNKTQTFYINETPNAQFSVNAANVCERQEFFIHNESSIGNGSLTYQWAFGNGNFSNTNSSTFSYTYSTAGNFNLQFTATSDSGCYAKDSIMINVSHTPVADFITNTLNNTYCSEKNITFTNLNSDTAVSYLWQFGDGKTLTSKHAYNQYENGGNYVVSLTLTDNLSGCYESKQKSLQIHYTPNADFIITPQICLGTQAEIVNQSSIGGETMSSFWNYGVDNNYYLNNSSIFPYQYSNEGNYQVTLIAQNPFGCSDTVIRQTVVHPVPLPHMQNIINTCANSYVLDAGNSGCTYLWSTGDTTQTITATQSGTYSVTTTNAFNCNITEQVQLNLAVPIVINLENLTSCGPALLDAGVFKHYQWSTGDTTRKILATTTGWYHVAVTDQNNCTASDSAYIVINPLPVVELGNNKQVCNNSSITLDAGNGFAHYLWSTGDTSQSIHPTITNSYWVQVTNNFNCINRDTVYVQFLQAPVINLPDSINNCGAITLSLGEFDNYSWSTGATTSFLTVHETGWYSVTVTNYNNCTTRDSSFVTIYQVPTIELGNNITACEGSAVVLNPGISNYQYLWSTGDTTNTINVFTTGNYSVTATTINGCTAMDNIWVSFIESPKVNLGPDIISCTPVTISANTLLPCQWNTGANSPSITATNSGIFYVTVTNSNGCMASDSIHVTIGAITTLDLGPNLTLCDGNSVVLNAGSGYTSYQWNTGATTPSIYVTQTGAYEVTVTNQYECTASDKVLIEFLPVPVILFPSHINACGNYRLQVKPGYASYLWNTGATTNQILIKTSGWYWVTVTASNGCSATDSVYVEIFELPVVNLAPNINACKGDTVILDAGQGFSSYLWSNGATTQTIKVTESKKYWVQVTNGNGCKATSQTTVTFNNKPIVNLGDNITACGQAVINAGQHTSYLWSTGETTPTITVTSSGIYSVIVYNQYGCSAFDDIEVNILPVPNVNLGPDIVTCYGNGVALDAGSGYATYQWSNGATTQTINPIYNGIYTVTVTNSFGCSASDAVSVQFLPGPVANLPSQVASCTSAILDAGNMGCTYLWNTGATSQFIIANQPGIYWVDISNSYCSVRDTVVVQLYAGPQPNLGANQGLCEGAQLLLNPNVPLCNACTYQWYRNGSLINTNPTLNISENGYYSVKVTNNIGCSGTAGKLIYTLPAPSKALTNAVACDKTVLSMPYHPDHTYLWNTGSTLRSIVVNQSGTYSVQVTNTYSNCAINDSAKVVINPLPLVYLGNDTAVCQGDSVLLRAQSNGMQYLWSNGATSQSIVIKNQNKYWLQVTDSNGCVNSDTMLLTLKVVPIINLSNATLFCPEYGLMLDAANVGSTYQWGADFGFSATSQTITAYQPGTYWVTVTAPGGCKNTDTAQIALQDYSVNANFLIATKAEINETLQIFELCYPEDIPINYFWTFGNGLSSTLRNPNITYYVTGNFPVTLTATNGFCADSRTKTITVVNSQNSRSLPVARDSSLNKDLLEITKARVFPNPTADRFAFEIQTNMETNLFIIMADMNSRIIFSYKVSKTSDYATQYNIRTLPTGVYVLKVYVGNRLERSFKIVKVKE